MSQLIFYDERHIYEVDGVRLPSVSEIIRFISREVYSDVNQYMLDNAANRGKTIHKAIESMLKYGNVEIEDDKSGYIHAFIKFAKDHNFKMVNSELSLFCDRFAGTLDLIGEVDGKISIIDIKTNSAINKPLVQAQLSGYRILTEHSMIGIDVSNCLQLMNTGKYRIYPVEFDRELFESCYTIHAAMNRKYGRGVI